MYESKLSWNGGCERLIECYICCRFLYKSASAVFWHCRKDMMWFEKGLSRKSVLSIISSTF